MVTKKPRKKRQKKEKVTEIPIRFEYSNTKIPVFWIGDDRVHFCQTDKTECGYKSVIVNAKGVDLVKAKDKKTRVPVLVRESNHLDIDFNGLPNYIGNDNPAFKMTFDKLKKVVRKYTKNGILPYDKVKEVVKEIEKRNAQSI